MVITKRADGWGAFLWVMPPGAMVAIADHINKEDQGSP
jgi:hypothetical protein